jgi:hypothetical protein
MEEEFKTGLANFYGTVGFRKVGDKYYMFLDDYSGEETIEISRAFYEEAKKEFIK